MVTEALLWILLPVVVYGLLAALLPDPGPPPWWRRRVRRWALRRQTRREARRAARALAQPCTPDPFEVLAVQMRLAAVARQLRALEEDPRTYALAHRLEATRAAYDDLLAQARHLAGVPGEDPAPRPGVRHRSEPERLADELELAERGWYW